MRNTTEWLMELELRSGNVYHQASLHFATNETLSSFLKTMANDEDWHYHVMLDAAAYLETHPIKATSIQVDRATRSRIESVFAALETSLADGTITEDIVLKSIADAEFSEWNDVFIYVINTLKGVIPEFTNIAQKIQAHRRSIEHFLEGAPAGKALILELKKKTPVWTERILVVDDDESLREILASIMERNGQVDTAENGKIALQKALATYFKLILSDIDMPEMNGLQFFQNLQSIYPDISSRFIFVTGDLSPQRKAFFLEHGLCYLGKPFTIREIQDLAMKTMHAS